MPAGCSKAEPKIFAPPQTPFPGARDGQNLIEGWSLPLPTNPVWRGSMHAISTYGGNSLANTPTNRQDRLQYTAPQLSAQCNKFAPAHNLYRLYRLYRQTVVTTTRRSTIGDRAFPLAASRVYNSLLSSADRLVAAVTARVQATAQDCAVCPLLYDC